MSASTPWRVPNRPVSAAGSGPAPITVRAGRCPAAAGHRTAATNRFALARCPMGPRLDRVALGVEAGQDEERRLEVVRAGARPQLGAGPLADHLAAAHEQQLVAPIGLVHDVAGDE